MKSFILSICFCLLCSVAEAATAYYYVKTGGTKTTGASTPDDWTTTSNLYARPNTVFYGNNLGEGDDDIVIVAGGTYTGIITIPVADSGTAGHPTVLKAKTGETVIFDLTSVTYGLNCEAQHVTLENFTVKNATERNLLLKYAAGNGAGLTVTNVISLDCPYLNSGGAKIQGHNNFDVNNYHADNNYYALEIRGCDGGTIDDCVFTNCFTGFKIHLNGENNTFTNCRVTDFSLLGFANSSSGNKFYNCEASGGSSASSTGFSNNGTFTGAEYFRCSSHDNAHDGFSGHLNGSAIKINSCLIYNNVSSGISFFGSTGCEVYNCVIFKNGNSSGTRAGFFQNTSGDTIVKNNIFYNNFPRSIAVDSQNITDGTTFDYNCFYRNGTDLSGGAIDPDALGKVQSTYYTYPEWLVAGYDANSIQTLTDPKFYSTATSNFSLRRNSPCINQGTDVSVPYDFLGYRRPNGAAEDIGAYEYYEKLYGSAHQSVSAVTASRVLKPSESGLVNVDSTAGAVAVYLPPLELSRGLPFCLHRSDASANTIIVYANESGETISGAASKALISQHDTLTVWGGSDQWYVDYGDIKTEDETATGTFTLNISGVTIIDSSGGAITGTLPDGHYIGQRKTIVMTDATTSSTVSATHHVTSDPEIATFNAVDETWILDWTGTEWVTIYATCTFI